MEKEPFIGQVPAAEKPAASLPFHEGQPIPAEQKESEAKCVEMFLKEVADSGLLGPGQMKAVTAHVMESRRGHWLHYDADAFYLHEIKVSEDGYSILFIFGIVTLAPDGTRSVIRQEETIDLHK